MRTVFPASWLFLTIAMGLAVACGISESLLRGLCGDGHCQPCGSTVCVCPGDKPCARECGSPCEMVCPDTGDCDLSCGHDCKVECASAGVCAVEVRGGGEIVCRGPGPCGVLCHGPCALECVGETPCNLYCDEDDVSGPQMCADGKLRCGPCPMLATSPE